MALLLMVGLLLTGCRRTPQLQSSWNRPLEVANVPGQELCVDLRVRAAGNLILEMEMKETLSTTSPGKESQAENTWEPRSLRRTLYFSSPRTQEVCLFLPASLLRDRVGSGNYEVRLLKPDGSLLESLQGHLEIPASFSADGSEPVELQENPNSEAVGLKEPAALRSNAGVVESVDTRDLQDAPQTGKK